MAKKGSDTRIKRQMAPTFWKIKRKQSPFVPRVKPGPHSKLKAYPLGVILRDILKLTTTMRETEKVLNMGRVAVDGIIRRDIKFPVGLMDVLEFVQTGEAYRFVPRNSELLVPIKINDNEKKIKLAKVISKVTTKGGVLQYGFHDGKTLLEDRNMMVGDTCIIQIPKTKIDNHVKFEKGCTVLITRGENAGKMGIVEDVRDGVFSLPKHAVVSLEEKSVELPVDMVMAVGFDKPILRVN